MAIRKNNSRQSDRNKIFKMNAQGYSIPQIEAKLSITPEHITYVLTQYEIDLASRKANSPELQERARIQLEVESRRKTTGPANDPDLAEIKAQLRKEIMAELTADKPAPTAIKAEAPAPTPDAELDDYKAIDVPGDEEPEVQEKTKARPRRKRTKA